METINNKAFTLIELIVVMAIVAILVLLAAPRFLGYTKDANVTAMQQDTKVLADASELYYIDKSEWPISGEAITNHGIGGVDELYPIDGMELESSIKNIKGDYSDYGLIVAGEFQGQIIHLNGVKDKDGFKHFGNELTDKKPIRFNGVNYEDINSVPEDIVDLYTFNKVAGGYEIVGFNSEYIDEKLSGIQPISISLPSIYLGEHVVGIADTEWENQNFEQINELILPKNLQYVGKWAFRGSNIKEVIFPDTVIDIREGSFNENELAYLDLPEGLESIRRWSFGGNKISNTNIPNTVTTIEGSAFNGNNLTSVVIPSSVNFIGDYAFRFNQFKHIVIPSTVESVRPYAFTYNLLEQIVIESESTQVFSNAFTDNGPSRKSPDLPEGSSVGTWNYLNNEWLKNN